MTELELEKLRARMLLFALRVPDIREDAWKLWEREFEDVFYMPRCSIKDVLEFLPEIKFDGNENIQIRAEKDELLFLISLMVDFLHSHGGGEARLEAKVRGRFFELVFIASGQRERAICSRLKRDDYTNLSFYALFAFYLPGVLAAWSARYTIKETDTETFFILHLNIA
ncbi:MAG: hypothetical protein JST84_04765 [Acidobacteria bacterium]|nr:hypothetical protein [Acidobacteriota bacterium]